MSTHYSDTRPRARKEHTCYLCRRTIRPGETYRRGAGMDGSTAWTWAECSHCDALARHLILSRLTYADDGYDFDLIQEWDPSDLTELRHKANYRRKWARRDGTLLPVPTFDTRIESTP